MNAILHICRRMQAVPAVIIFTAVCVCAGVASGSGDVSGGPVVVEEKSFSVAPGEEWRMDWSWREVDVPLTALLRPRVMALDADAKIVYLRYVGQIQQRTFGPEDMAVQRWCAYARVLDGNPSAAIPANYAVSIDKIELPAAARRVSMQLVREGDGAEVADIVISSMHLTVPPAPQIDGFPKMLETPSDVLSDVELDAVLARREKCVPRLARVGDRTELYVNGRRVLPRIFKTAAFEVPNRLPSVTALSKKGFNIVTIGINLAPSARAEAQSSTGIWREDGMVDCEKVRLEIRRYLKRFPDGMFMLVFIIQPRLGWCEENATEVLRDHDGKYGIVRGVYRVTDYRERLEYNWRKDEFPAFSYASEKFAADVAEVLEKLFAELEKWPEGKPVIGAYLNGGTDTQWLDAFNNDDIPGRQMADCSDVAKRRFSEFCKARGLCGAYADGAFAPESLYRQFYGMATAEMRLRMAKGVKKGSGGRMLVGGYSPNGGLAGYPLFSQSCTLPLLTSSDWDFFAVVPDYVREHTDPVMSAAFDGSFVNRSKLFVSELDLRSHDVGNWGYWGSDFWRSHHTDGTFRRKALFFAANALTHGGTYHAYDMDGGMYATDTAQETWRVVNEMAAKTVPEPVPDESIALVAGERYWDFQPLDRDRAIPYELREMPRDALSRAGVHWSCHMAEELLDAPEANLPGVVLFADLTTVTAAQFLELRRRYARDGRVVVWCYRPGLFAHDGAKIEKELGLGAAPNGMERLGFSDGTCPDRLMAGVRGILMPTFSVWGFAYPRLCTPLASAGWKPLAVFGGTDVCALAVRRHRDYTEVYTSMPGGVTPQLLRNLLRETGAEPLVDSNEISGYGSGLFYIVAQSAGTKRFHLPKGRRPGSLIAGRAWREEGRGFATDMERGDIFVITTEEYCKTKKERSQ